MIKHEYSFGVDWFPALSKTNNYEIKPPYERNFNTFPDGLKQANICLAACTPLEAFSHSRDQ